MSFNSYNPEGMFNTAHVTSQASMSSTSSGIKRSAHEVGLDKELMPHFDTIGEFRHLDSQHPSLRQSNVQANGEQARGPQNPKSNVSSGKKTKGRVKIKMEFIDNKLRRYTTFSKRKTGIMKKAYELSTLTGTQVMLLVASETGHVYTFATRKLQPMITSQSGKALIQTCLNSPDPPTSLGPTSTNNDQRMSATGYEETELTYAVPEDEQEKGITFNGAGFSPGSPSGTDSDLDNGSPMSPGPMFSSGSPSSSASLTPSLPSRAPPGIIFPPDVPECSDIGTDTADKNISLVLPPITSASSSQLYVVTKPVVIPSKQIESVDDRVAGGSVMMGGPGSLVYTSGGMVYAQAQTSCSDSSTSLLVNLPHELQQISDNAKGSGNGGSQMVTIPVNLASHFQSSGATSGRSGSQSLPTDLSMPLKKERR